MDYIQEWQIQGPPYNKSVNAQYIYKDGSQRLKSGGSDYILAKEILFNFLGQTKLKKSNALEATSTDDTYKSIDLPSVFYCTICIHYLSTEKLLLISLHDRQNTARDWCLKITRNVTPKT